MKKFVCLSACVLVGAMPALAQEKREGASGIVYGPDGQPESNIDGYRIVLEPIDVIGIRPSDANTAAASITRLDENALAIRSAPNLADALRAVPGVAVSRSGGPGSLTQVRLRGAEANHTLVLFDGVDVSDPVTGETDFGLLTSLPGARIVVLRGAASSIHGTDAIGGVVAISSVQSEDAFNAALEAGSLETFQAGVSASNEMLTGALSAFSTGGIDTSGLGGEHDGSEAYSGFLKAQTDFSGWTLSGFALARRSQADIDSDGDFDGRLENSDSETEADQWLIGAGLDGKTGAIDHRFRASVNEVTRDNVLASALQDSSTGERAQISWSPAYAVDWHQFAGLVSLRRETYDRGDVQFGGFTNTSEAFESVSIAAQYGIEIGDMRLEATARQDFNDGRFEDAATWRAGASYQFPQLEAQVRASIATGIKNPTFTELFGFFPGSFIGNPDLKPEEALSFEIGWDQYLLANGLHYSLTAFSANLEHEIYTAFTPTFSATALNRNGASERKGLEVAARWSPADALSFNGQVTSIASENEAGEDEVRVPNITASLSASWTPKEGQSFGLALDYVGEQDDFDFASFPAARVTLDDYVLVSAHAEWALSDRVALTLRGDNLLDEKAQDVFGYATPGAGAYVGLRLR